MFRHIEKRMNRHRALESFDRELKAGEWWRVSEFRSKNGGTLIIESNQAKEKLLKSEENLKAFSNATEDFTVLIEPDGTILLVNLPVAKQFGIEQGKMQAITRSQLLPEPISLGFHSGERGGRHPWKAVPSFRKPLSWHQPTKGLRPGICTNGWI
jgi:PAS domain-containing protein